MKDLVVPFVDLTPVTRQLMPEINAAISGVLERGQYLRGREVAKFEQEWADYCGQSYCVTCASGTDALTLATMAEGLDRTSIQANTIPLTGIGLARGGCEVELIDVGNDGRSMVARKDQVPVLLYGRQPSTSEYQAKLFDAAHAHGWQPPSGATACWSFYPTKTLGALGDAGAITTNNAEVAYRMRNLAGPDDQLRDRTQISSRMDELQAAVLRVKLRYLDKWLDERRKIVNLYETELDADVNLIPEQAEGFNHLVVLQSGKRDLLQSYLLENGVQTKVHFPTPLNQLDGPWITGEDQYPGAERWCACVLSLPCYPGMTRAQVRHVCRLVRIFYQKK